MTVGQSNDSLRIPFLNYLASQQSRARKPLIVRIGGNTQDSSSIDLAQNKSIVKSRPPGAPNSYTGTPDVSFGPSLLATMKAVGDTVPVRWIFGLQLKNVSQDANDRLVAEQAEAILGDQLLSLQIGAFDLLLKRSLARLTLACRQRTRLVLFARRT